MSERILCYWRHSYQQDAFVFKKNLMSGGGYLIYFTSGIPLKEYLHNLVNKLICFLAKSWMRRINQLFKLEENKIHLPTPRKSHQLTSNKFVHSERVNITVCRQQWAMCHTISWLNGNYLESLLVAWQLSNYCGFILFSSTLARLALPPVSKFVKLS